MPPPQGARPRRNIKGTQQRPEVGVGSGRDSRNTLRIYYYWDDEKEKVVIVSLTKHLTTSAS